MVIRDLLLNIRLGLQVQMILPLFGLIKHGNLVRILERRVSRLGGARQRAGIR